MMHSTLTSLQRLSYYRKGRAMKRNHSTVLDRYLTPIALLLVTIAMLGCNTTEGAGKDIEAAGDGIKDAARDAKD